MARTLGQASTSATTRVPLAAATYTEPTSGAQRSLVSSSANDAAAGTGARTVRITYYTLAADGTIAGPFYETVTLNGTTPVATVGTNICLIEKMEVMSAGSGGVPAGTISLNSKSDGTGSTIASIAAGAVSAFLGVHYVASGKQCRLTDLTSCSSGQPSTLVEITRTPYPLGIEQTLIGPVEAGQSGVPVGVAIQDGGVIPGPARLRLMVTPGSSSSQVTYGNFGFVEERSGAF